MNTKYYVDFVKARGGIAVEISKDQLAEDCERLLRAAIEENPFQKKCVIFVEKGNVDKSAINTVICDLSAEFPQHQLMLLLG